MSDCARAAIFSIFFCLRVTDSGAPPLNDSKSFRVIVLPPPRAGIFNAGSGMVSISFDTIPGRTYRVDYKDHLDDPMWTPLTTDTVAGGASMTVNDTIGGRPQRFYRIVEVN